MEEKPVEIVSVNRSKELGLQYLRGFPCMEGGRNGELRINFFLSKKDADAGAEPARSLRFDRDRDMTTVFAYLS